LVDNRPEGEEKCLWDMGYWNRFPDVNNVTRKTPNLIRKDLFTHHTSNRTFDTPLPDFQIKNSPWQELGRNIFGLPKIQALLPKQAPLQDSVQCASSLLLLQKPTAACSVIFSWGNSQAARQHKINDVLEDKRDSDDLPETPTDKGFCAWILHSARADRSRMEAARPTRSEIPIHDRLILCKTVSRGSTPRFRDVDEWNRELHMSTISSAFSSINAISARELLYHAQGASKGQVPSQLGSCS